MTYLKKIFFLTAFVYTAITSASPSESNSLQLNFNGADAQRFRATEVQKSSLVWGDQDSNILNDYTFSFVKELGTSGYKFVLEIACQQRVLNYRTTNPVPQAPFCSFTYFTDGPEEVSPSSSILAYTYIEMTPEVSKRMIQQFNWSEHPSGFSYFGCYDNEDSGCPSITFTPRLGSYENLVEVVYYKP